MTRRRRIAAPVALLLAGYVLVAYYILPMVWTDYEGRVTVAPRAMVTTTREGIPGDPINLGLVGTKADIMRAFAEAAWNPADPVTLASAVEIGLSVALDRPYKDAPISTLIYEGREQDLAFEKQAGASADRRHHVRLWLTPQSNGHDIPLWLGSASFDRGVGISHDTGEITHHIGPDVDTERDYVVENLENAGWVVDSYEVPGIGPTWEGRNGGGDLYYTDGNALIGVLTSGAGGP